MARVHHFQRYSSYENTVTNNTLLLIARIYASAPQKAAILINELIRWRQLTPPSQVLLNRTYEPGRQPGRPDQFSARHPARLLGDAGSRRRAAGHLRGALHRHPRSAAHHRHLLGGRRVLARHQPVSAGTVPRPDRVPAPRR